MGVEIAEVTVTTCDWCQTEYLGEAELHLDTSESFRLWDSGMYGNSASVDVCPDCAKAFLDVRAEIRGEGPTPEPEPLDLTAPNFFLIHTGNDLVDEILAAVVEAATMENNTLYWGEPRDPYKYRYEDGESPVSRIQDAADRAAERLGKAT